MTFRLRISDASPDAVPASAISSVTASVKVGRTAVAILAGVILPSSLVAAALVAPQPSVPTPFHAHEVTAAPRTVLLTCMDAQVDPFNAHHIQPITPLILPAGQGKHEGVRVQWHNQGDQKASGDDAGAPALAALSVAAQAGGDLRGLSLSPCIQPQTQHWFASGRTTNGEDTLIRVTNPSATEAVVTMRLWGTQGPITTNDSVFTVPAGASTTLRPGISAANQERVAVALETNGTAIGAWMLSSAMDGEVPQGAAWIPSTAPAMSHIIPGFSDGDSTIRLANPSDEPTQVSVEWVVDAQRRLLPGGTVELAPGTMTDLPLPQVGEGYATAVVTSDMQPIIAQAAVRRSGKQWPQGKKKWASRTLLTPVASVSEAVFPSLMQLQAEIEQQAKSKPLRPTSVPTKNGFSISRASILIVNTHDAPTTVTIAHAEPITVPAQSQVSVDMADTESSGNTQSTGEPLMLKADNPVHVAIALRAQTPTGDVEALYPVTVPNLAHTTVQMLSR